MKKLFTTATYATIFSLLAVSAMAKNYSNNDGFYVGLSGDIAFKKNSKANVNGTSNQIDYGFNSGANVALGYNATSNIRLEAEGGYHAFGIKKTTVGNSSTSRSTDLKITTIMGNAFYDFNNSSSFSPYIGAGAGVAFVNLPTYILNTDKSVDNKFAYQLMAGVAYTAPSLPSINWYAGYRYINVAAPRFVVDQSSGGGVAKFGRIGFSNIEAGLRYNF